MGLSIVLRDGDTYLDGVSRSASGFHEFRSELARAAGIRLEDMAGFFGCTPWANVHDDIAPLLAHSDSDGGLSPDECARTAPRLRELAAQLGEEFDRNWGLALADLMEQAARRNLPLAFQ